MNAVKFDFLNEVDDVEIYEEFVFFKLQSSVNEVKPSFVSAFIVPKVKTLSVEVNNSNDPQNSFDKDLDVFAVDSETIAIVDDFINVHAIREMPFVLTPSQVNIINQYLADIAIENMEA